jgi:putative flippase GtrA
MKNKLFALTKRHTHFTKFLLFSSTNTIFDLVLIFLFANVFGFNIIASNILSTGLTMCLSFYLNHHFVFYSTKQKRRTVIQFAAVTIFNIWLIQSSFIALAIHIFRDIAFFAEHHWTLNLFSKFCGIAASFMLNYLMYHFIFRQKQFEEPVVL